MKRKSTNTSDTFETSDINKKIFNTPIKVVSLENSLEYYRNLPEDKQQIFLYYKNQIDPLDTTKIELDELIKIYNINTSKNSPVNKKITNLSKRITNLSKRITKSSPDHVFKRIKKGRGGYAKTKNKLKCKKCKTKKKYKGGSPYYKNAWNSLTVLKLNYNDEEYTIYSSSLPFSGNIGRLHRFYKEELNIKTIISLQGCGITHDSIHKKDCKSFAENDVAGINDDSTDYNYESKSWLLTDPDNIFTNNEIKDFTAGTLENFQIINSSEIWKDNTLIHCLAGFGRTGSILLFYWFRFNVLTEPNGYEKLINPFFNFNKVDTPVMTSNQRNSDEMFSYLYGGFRNNINIPYMYGEFVQNNYSIEYMLKELFNFRNLNYANLLITRVNYMILFTALFLNTQTYGEYPGIPNLQISEVYFYPRHESIIYPVHNGIPDENDPFNQGADLFKNPVRTNINEYIATNNFGFLA